MPRNPPDSWGQLGRMRAIGGPASTKSVDTPYLAVGFAGASKADGLERHGAAMYPETFGSVLPCKRNKFY